MNDFKGNFLFNEEFFKALKAPQYRVEIVEAAPPTETIFPPEPEYMIMFGDQLGVWHSFTDLNVQIYSNEITANPAMGKDPATTSVVTYFHVAGGRRIARLKGYKIPAEWKHGVTAWDVLGQDGTIHNLESWQDVGNGKVQAIMESITVHPVQGGEDTLNDNRFGLIFPYAEPPQALGVLLYPSYAVDYPHIYVAAVDGDFPSVRETLMRHNFWPPANFDLTNIHREPGRYPCEKIGKHILFRVL